MQLLTIPQRQPNASAGSDFCQSIVTLGPTQQRDDLILNELAAGNMPDFMRNLATITITSGSNTLIYYVTPDVLCVGSDSDFIRTPIQAKTAKRIANQFYCILPTKKMCDQIWAAADLKLNPDPNGPPYNEVMQMVPAFVSHNTKVQNQIANRPYTLLTGHKKDLIFDKALLINKSCISIYGWFYTNGIPIQGPRPNSSSHAIAYCDYADCIRLIYLEGYLNGNVVKIADIINDPVHSNLINDEGPFDISTIYA